MLIDLAHFFHIVMADGGELVRIDAHAFSQAAEAGIVTFAQAENVEQRPLRLCNQKALSGMGFPIDLFQKPALVQR